MLAQHRQKGVAGRSHDVTIRWGSVSGTIPALRWHSGCQHLVVAQTVNCDETSGASTMRTLLGIGILSAAAVAGQSFSFVGQTSSPPAVGVRVAQRDVPSESLAVNIPGSDVNSPAVINPPLQESSEALRNLISQLKRSAEEIRRIPAYTAVLEQQVFHRDRLLDAEKMELKLRHAPFSVYLRWPGDNQQALYVDGQNDNRLLVRPTRGLASLRGTWRLRPDSAQAMQDSRYPITTLGIEKLCQMILDFHVASPQPGHADLVCRERTSAVDGRPTTAFDLQFASQESCPEYSRATMHFDNQTHLLISVENFRWGPDGGRDELLERYVYHDFAPAALSEEDFSHENAAYSFNQ